MRFLTRPRIQWAGGGLAAWLALAAPAPGRAAAALDVVRTTKAAPAGFVEIGGVEAGAFNPAIWQAGTLHWVPDLRSPLLAPRSGKFRNIYAPSAVETPGGYRLFYGAWDGLPTGNDCLYSATTDANFQKFSHRRAIIVPGGYVHVCNVNALGLDGGGFELLATVYPVRERNKPGFFRSDATGTNWNGGRGEPYTVRARDIIAMDGYAYPNADINGMNVLLREDGARRLYFGDFRGGGGTFRATSRDGRNYTFEAKVLAGPGLVNDVKKFRVGADCYYLMGLHENRRRLWQTISTNGLAFPPARELLAHLDAADAYIVALGWVTRGAQESPGRRLLGVLYGAGPVSALDQNRIYARWLQKRVDFVARDGTRISGTRALGPGQQLLDFAGSPARRGRFELYAEDGVTRLGVSPEFDVQSGQVFHLR